MFDAGVDVCGRLQSRLPLPLEMVNVGGGQDC
jgi:hypothetical protein